LKHSKNKLELANSKNASKQVTTARFNELEQIPKIFYDSNFSLSNKETFNSLISLKIFERTAASTAVSAAATAKSNGMINFSTNKNDAKKPEETEACKFILDKVSSL
jgi:hypothetical protein